MQSSTQSPPNLYALGKSPENRVLHVIGVILTKNDPMFKRRTSFKDIILGKGRIFLLFISEKLCLLLSVNFVEVTYVTTACVAWRYATVTWNAEERDGFKIYR